MKRPPIGRLQERLKGVSRSFQLSLRVLPRRIRFSIGLAYLLARTSDTIADAAFICPPDRLAALRDFRRRLLDSAGAPIEFGRLVSGGGTESERRLLVEAEASVRLLDDLSRQDREHVQRVLTTISGGQELDLVRFQEAGPGRMVALRTRDELDDYTYRVAGCVGEFWTEICLAHLPGRPTVTKADLLKEAVLFGKGLQLINILRDVAGDLRLGRCYMPAEDLRHKGLRPEDLLEAQKEGEFRKLYDGYLDWADACLAAGWSYTNHLPYRWFRVRLACAWPILIGASTLAQLRTRKVLDPERRVKVPRSTVKRWMWLTLVRYPFPASWRKLYPITWDRSLG